MSPGSLDFLDDGPRRHGTGGREHESPGFLGPWVAEEKIDGFGDVGGGELLVALGLPDFVGAIGEADEDVDAVLSLAGRPVRPCFFDLSACCGKAARKTFKVGPAEFQKGKLVGTRCCGGRWLARRIEQQPGGVFVRNRFGLGGGFGLRHALSMPHSPTREQSAPSPLNRAGFAADGRNKQTRTRRLPPSAVEAMQT